MAWEVWTMRMFSNWSLFFLGRWSDLSQRTEEQLAEARDRGNAYALAITRTPYGFVTWLARGDVDGARHAVQEASAGWASDRFQTPHYWFLLAECLLGLYTGRGEEAWARLHARWPQVAASLVMRVPVVGMQMHHLRGSCALAACVGARRKGRAFEPALREAERAARRLRRFRVLPADSLAMLLEAGIAMQRGRDDEAARLLGAAARDLERCETVAYGGAARRHLSRFKGSGPPVSILPGHQLASEDALANMLAPGFLP